MRILVLADSAVPVPPAGYGGTERILGYLIDALAQRRHQVTLVGAAGSRSPGRLMVFTDARGRSHALRAVAKLAFWARLAREVRRHDVVHSALRLDYLLPALRDPIPKVLHFHTAIAPTQVGFVRRHARGRLVLSGVGKTMTDGLRDWGTWRPVHNGIPVQRYRYSAASTAPPYLAFLGKLMPAKGAHTAIDVAKQVGWPLVIAGNVGTTKEHRHYFDTRVQPHIDGTFVRYVGEVNDQDKQVLLGGAAALLNPTEFDEAFGLTAVEALACGTPVITFGRGELPSIIHDGRTGFVCNDAQAMADAVRRVRTIDRWACRQEAEQRFDVATMVEKFEDVYRWLLSGDSHVPSEWAEP